MGAAERLRPAAGREAPAACHRGAPGASPARGLPLRERQAGRAQGREGVVGDGPGPHEVPQRLLQYPGLQLQVREQVTEEARAGSEALAQGLVLGGRRHIGRLGPRLGRRPEQRKVLAEVEGYGPTGAPQGAGAQPNELAAGAEGVEPRWRVAAQATRQHIALPGLWRERETLKRHELFAQAVDRGCVLDGLYP